MSMVLTAQLLPCERPAIHPEKDGPGRVVMRVSIRSAFPHIIAALEADMHTFIQELFEGRPGLPSMKSCQNGPFMQRQRV